MLALGAKELQDVGDDDDAPEDDEDHKLLATLRARWKTLTIS